MRTLAERLFSKVDVNGPVPVHLPELGPCHLWTGSRLPRGYGQIGYNGRVIGAHVAAWLVHVGPVPEGHCVLHYCDNPPCVNRVHLFTGTDQDNMDDMVAKGRTRRGADHHFRQHPELIARGDRLPQTRVSEAQALEVLRQRAAGVSTRTLADALGVNISTVQRICDGTRSLRLD
jgi:hypothetical protein